MSPCLETCHAFLPITAVPMLTSWKLNFVLLCVPSLSPLLRRWRFVVCALWLQCNTWMSAMPSRSTSYAILCLECYPKCSKQNASWPGDTPNFHWSIIGACDLMSEHSVFFIMIGLIVEMLFHAVPIENAVQWAENEWIQSLLANDNFYAN